jgi:predicted NBD/HSP70 family sugar kinase
VLSGLRELVACPVVFENDVNLAAIGELSRGAGRGVDDFVLVSIGTGLGMGVVLDGRLHRGASGLAGEVGYLPTAGAEHIEAAIGLRGQGAMERLVSSHAVVDLAKEAGLSPASSAAAVIDAARAGDPVALQVVDTIAARLAFCIASVAAVLDPELVIVGGGIGTGAGPLLLEPLRRNLAAISPLRPRLGTSELGSAAVVVGAVTEGLRLVVERIFDVDASPATAAVGAPGAAS